MEWTTKRVRDLPRVIYGRPIEFLVSGLHLLHEQKTFLRFGHKYGRNDYGNVDNSDYSCTLQLILTT